MINCSLIGFGNWGERIYKSLNEDNLFKIKYICRKRKSLFKKKLNKIKIVDSYKEAINDNISAVFIASPSETHFKIAKYALEKNKNVFVEKPICFTVEEYLILKEIFLKFLI